MSHIMVESGHATMSIMVQIGMLSRIMVESGHANISNSRRRIRLKL